MHLKTRAIGIALSRRARLELERTARDMLGRLQRRVRAASLTLMPDDDAEQPRRFLCDFQLALGDAAPIRVCYRGTGQSAAVIGALKRARQALLRRSRRRAEPGMDPALLDALGV